MPVTEVRSRTTMPRCRCLLPALDPEPGRRTRRAAAPAGGRDHDDLARHEGVRRAVERVRAGLGERVRAARAPPKDARVERAVVGRGRVSGGPLLVQVTLSPAVTVIVLGMNLKSLIVSPPAARATARTLTACCVASRTWGAPARVSGARREPPGRRAPPASGGGRRAGSGAGAGGGAGVVVAGGVVGGARVGRLGARSRGRRRALAAGGEQQRRRREPGQQHVDEHCDAGHQPNVDAGTGRILPT